MSNCKPVPTPKSSKSIVVRGCSVNNLKNIDVDIPRNELTVITGVSGSGKSSLAFDTLYAEGQRRFVESLSSYTRQFLARIKKPNCRVLANIPPAIAIEQRKSASNPRSTVGTSSEVYDYLRVLMARAGKMYAPDSDVEVKRNTVNDVVSFVCSLDEASKFLLMAPIKVIAGRTVYEHLQNLLAQGYSRIFFNQELCRIDELSVGDFENVVDSIFLVVDRLSVKPDDEAFLSRVADSVDSAFYEGHGYCSVYELGSGLWRSFSNIYEVDGVIYEPPTPNLFNFNTPAGACQRCEGFGSVLDIDPNLVIPDPNLSLYDDCVSCWIGPKSSEWKREFIYSVKADEFDIYKPYKDLSHAECRLLWDGRAKTGTQPKIWGINDYFDNLRSKLYKIQNRVRLSKFRGRTICPECHGGRIKKDGLLVQYLGCNIAEICSKTIDELLLFFGDLPIDENERLIAEPLLKEINSRLRVLSDVGLGYLTLDRSSNTLSGGEYQRINLATRLGNALIGSLYVLDEPSIGLHERDSDRLINVILQLRDQGNSVVVVEHDERMMRASDYLIDIGPDAGRLGGEVVYAGATNDINDQTPGHTASYLRGKSRIALPTVRRVWNNHIDLLQVNKNNLKKFDVAFPLDIMTVVTGVSGSGKSTLVCDLLYNQISHYLEDQLHYYHPMLSGDYRLVDSIEYVDQNGLGISSRSNPVTYIGAFNDIRELFSMQPLSVQMGYKPYYFSLNKDGGRCDVCEGKGSITVEMQFMDDIVLECEECQGKRYRKEILDVLYNGISIADMLDMTVNQIIEFLELNPDKKKISRLIVKKLSVLQRVGLGYIKLGQSSSTMSGGETQRLKLAYFLNKDKKGRTLYIFDEPTTGLHFNDINILLSAFNDLVDSGNTVIIIEHNLDVIKCADYLIDLGPDGGPNGGQLIACGTPEEVANCKRSITGQYLKSKLRL